MSSQINTENTTEKVINLIEELNMDDYYTEAKLRHGNSDTIEIIKLKEPILKKSISSLKYCIKNNLNVCERKCKCFNDIYDYCSCNDNDIEKKGSFTLCNNLYIDGWKIYIELVEENGKYKSLNCKCSIEEGINSNEYYYQTVNLFYVVSSIVDDSSYAYIYDILKNFIKNINNYKLYINDSNIDFITKEHYNNLININKELGLSMNCSICLEDCLETEHLDCCKSSIHMKCLKTLLKNNKEDGGFICPACRKRHNSTVYIN